MTFDKAFNDIHAVTSWADNSLILIRLRFMSYGEDSNEYRVVDPIMIINSYSLFDSFRLLEG